MEIDLNREIVAAIIDKAREFNEEADVTPLDSHSRKKGDRSVRLQPDQPAMRAGHV